MSENRKPPAGSFSCLASWRGAPGHASFPLLFVIVLAGWGWGWGCGAVLAEGGGGGAWRPVTVATREGSRLLGRLRTVEALRLRSATGATRALPWKEVRRVRFGQRMDPRLEARAQAAVQDLHSEQYETRRKAVEALKALGRSAARVLREARHDSDAEVASRARQLLGALGGGAAEAFLDRVTLRSGRTHSGSLAVKGFIIQTSWGVGVFKFPPAALEFLELGGALAGQVRALRLPPPPRGASARAVRAPPPDPAPAGPLAQRFSPNEAAGNLWAPGVGVGAGAGFPVPDLTRPFGFHLAGFDHGPDRKAKPLKAGDSVEDLYAPWGLLIRAAGAGRSVVADGTETLLGVTKGLAASVKEPRGQGGIELRFVQPGRFDPKTRSGVPGGVYAAGCLIGKSAEGTVGMEAFGRDGRLLARIFNRREGNVVAGGAMASEFLGLRGKTPIARLRIFRTPGKGQAALRIDDVLFGAILPLDRDLRLAAVTLRSGQRLVGRIKKAKAAQTLALRPAFFPKNLAPLALPLERIRRIEPPLAPKDGDAHLKIFPARHAVLLQNGERFRALLTKLDGKEAHFRLPGGAELTLPRLLLRKIDLWPKAAPPGKAPAPFRVAKGEKPGVEFRRKKRGPANPAAPQKPDDPAKIKKNPGAFPTQGLPRMDHAEILRVDFKHNELSVDPKDGAGEWTIDLASARFLVFPPIPQAARAQARERRWVLVLRQGSRFRANVRAVGPETIELELAGGVVQLPPHSVASLARQPGKPGKPGKP